jgi:hypothetical protein
MGAATERDAVQLMDALAPGSFNVSGQSCSPRDSVLQRHWLP